MDACLQFRIFSMAGLTPFAQIGTPYVISLSCFRPFDLSRFLLPGGTAPFGVRRQLAIKVATFAVFLNWRSNGPRDRGANGDTQLYSEELPVGAGKSAPFPDRDAPPRGCVAARFAGRLDGCPHFALVGWVSPFRTWKPQAASAPRFSSTTFCPAGFRVAFAPIEGHPREASGIERLTFAKQSGLIPTRQFWP